MPGKRKMSEDLDAAAMDIEEYMQEKKAKKPRKSKAEAGSSNKASPKRRGNAGKLERMNSIPVDVFLEIAKYLHPPDILTLARTTKAWRAILMSKNSRPVWRAALRSLPFVPQCPEDMSEPEYVRLFFGNECYDCGTRNVEQTYFLWRTRLCGMCRYNNARIFKAWERAKINDQELLAMVPHHICPYRGTRHDKMSLLEEWKRVVPKKRAQLSPQAYKAWASQQKATVDALLQSSKQFADARQEWDNYKYELKKPKEAQREAKSQQRKEAVIARLKALNYSEWDINAVVRSYAVKTEIHSAVKLTDKGFEKIRPKIEAEINQLRAREAARLKKRGEELRKNELMALYNDFYSQNNGGSTKVTLADFLELPCVARLWNNWEVQVTRELWPSREDIEKDVQTKTLDIECELRRLILNGKQRGPEAPLPSVGASSSVSADDSSDLLAEHVFSCDTCGRPLIWPSLLQHECVREFDPDRMPVRSDYTLDFRIEKSRRFETKLVRTSDEYMRMVEGLKGVARTAGHAASTVTDLERLHFGCLLCNPDGPNAMDWLDFMWHVHYQYDSAHKATRDNIVTICGVTDRPLADTS